MYIQENISGRGDTLVGPSADGTQIER
jgi:hypothetical protein